MKIELALCQECLHDFLLNPQTIIYRANYRQIDVDKCCVCQVRWGFDYVIEERVRTNVQSKNRTFDSKKYV